MTVKTNLSKAQIAYQHIAERITSGTFSPGHRLVLDQLARDLGMSTVPVREALRMLEAEGLIEYQRNIGATVSMINVAEYFATMQTLSIIEGAATGLAVGSITSDDIAKARAINEQMRASLVDFAPEEFTQLNQEFHTVLFERCPNPYLLKLVRRAWGRLARMRKSTFSFVPGRSAQSVEEHEALLVLIEQNGLAHDVEAAARNHRAATLEAYLKYTARPMSGD